MRTSDAEKLALIEARKTGRIHFVGLLENGVVNFSHNKDIFRLISVIVEPSGATTSFGIPRSPDKVSGDPGPMNRLLSALADGVLVLEDNTLRNTRTGAEVTF